MDNTLEEFVIVHPYTEEEFIQPTLRALGCEKFNVLNIKELDRIKTITSNLTKLDVLKYNPIYPDISYIPTALFIQYPVIAHDLPERLVRSDFNGKDIEIETTMSLIIPSLNTTYTESAFSLHNYSNLSKSVLNKNDLLYKEEIIKELVIVGRYVKGSRYTLRFNYELFLKLCHYLNKSLIYV
jgi:hypothetical protein